MMRIRTLEPLITVWRAPLVISSLPSLRRLADISGQKTFRAKALFSTLSLIPEDKNWFIAVKRRADKDQDERARNSRRLIEAQTAYHDLPHSQARLRLNECLRSLSEQAYRQCPRLKSKPLQVFISYAHPFENVDSFERWTQAFIFRLRDDLHTAGLQVILDDIHSVPGKSPIDFMKNCVKSSDVLLMVGTETLGYKGTHQKADHHEYFVRYELMEIWQRHQIVCQQTDIPSSSTPLLPILISGNTDTVFDWMFKEKEYHPTVYEFNEGAFLGFNNVYIGQLKRLIDAMYKHAGIPSGTFDVYWDLMEQTLIHSAIFDAMPSASSTGLKPIKNSTLRIFQAPPVNHYFVPRKDLMKKIEERLADSDNVPMSCRLVVLSGMGGIGKTHLVRYYFQTYSEFYKFSGYFNVASLEDLLNQYRVLAENLDLFATSWRPHQDESAIITTVVNWLTETGHTLLVYDNVQCALADLELFLPKMGKHTIFVTTRRNDWPNSVNVSTMSSIECQQLMKNITGRYEEHEQINTLSQAMGYLPLAMSQACAHIKMHHLSIQAYLSLYEKNKQKLLVSNTMPAGLAHDHYSVWITFQMAFQIILHTHPSIIYLLETISLLNPAHIPKSLLTDWLLKTPVEDYKRRKNDIAVSVKTFVCSLVAACTNIVYLSVTYGATGLLIYFATLEIRFILEMIPIFLLNSIILFPYFLIKKALLSVFYLLQVSPKYYFYDADNRIFTLINEQITNGIPVLCQNHLINYDERTELITVHPLVSEFLLEFTITDSFDIKNGYGKQLIGVLQELLHKKYLTAKYATGNNENDLIKIMGSYRRLYACFKKIDKDSYYDHLFYFETKWSQCERSFIFFVDLFEMNLYFDDIISAEECLLEAMYVIATVSQRYILKETLSYRETIEDFSSKSFDYLTSFTIPQESMSKETLDCREMYITLSHAIDEINSKKNIYRKQEFNLSKKFNENRTLLMVAVIANEIKVVQWLVGLGASLKDIDYYGFTALLHAAERGYINIAKLLLDMGSVLTEIDSKGNNAVLLAASRNQVNMLKFLCQLSIPLSTRNYAGQTALIVASAHGAIDAVLYLLRLGESLKARDNEGYTALLHAGLNRDNKMIKFLLTNGADFRERVRSEVFGKKAKSVINIVKNENTMTHLKNDGFLPTSFTELESWLSDWPIIEAIKAGDLPALQLHCFQANTYFPGFFSSSRKAKMLPKIEKLKGINLEDFNGDTLLFYAVKDGHEPIFRFLLLKGADYKHRNQSGDSVLHVMIRTGQIHLLATLLENEDFDIDMQNNENFTPLMLAAMQVQVGTVEQLLKRGANIELRNNFGQRAIDLTEDAMIKETLNALAFRMINNPR